MARATGHRHAVILRTGVCIDGVVAHPNHDRSEIDVLCHIIDRRAGDLAHKVGAGGHIGEHARSFLAGGRSGYQFIAARVFGRVDGVSGAIGHRDIDHTSAGVDLVGASGVPYRGGVGPAQYDAGSVITGGVTASGGVRHVHGELAALQQTALTGQVLDIHLVDNDGHLDGGAEGPLERICSGNCCVRVDPVGVAAVYLLPVGSSIILQVNAAPVVGHGVLGLVLAVLIKHVVVRVQLAGHAVQAALHLAAGSYGKNVVALCVQLRYLDGLGYKVCGSFSAYFGDRKAAFSGTVDKSPVALVRHCLFNVATIVSCIDHQVAVIVLRHGADVLQHHGEQGAVGAVRIVVVNYAVVDYTVDVNRGIHQLELVGRGDLQDGRGPHTGGILVLTHQYAVHDAQLDLVGHQAVARRSRDILQGEGAAQLIFDLVHGQGQAILGGEDHLALAVDGNVDVRLVAVLIVHVEIGVGYHLAVLVDKGHAGGGGGGQVVLQLEVGGVAAALQIEELQGVIVVVLQGPGGSSASSVNTAIDLLEFDPSIFEYILKAGNLFTSFAIDVADGHSTRGKVDLYAGGIMDAAQVCHQHAVHEDPHIVVAGELKGGAGILLIVGIAAVLLDEAGGQSHAEVVVQVLIIRRKGFTVGIIIKGEEHACSSIIIIRIPHSPVFIELKAARFLIKIGVVLLAVINIIASLVDLQQAAHVFVGRLTIRSSIRIKQIGQGPLLVVSITNTALEDGGLPRKDGVAVISQAVRYNTLENAGIRPGPMVHRTCSIAIRLGKFQGVSTVDARIWALGLAVSIFALVFCLVIDPIVEQVHDGARRGDGIIHRARGRRQGRQCHGREQRQHQHQDQKQAEPLL